MVPYELRKYFKKYRKLLSLLFEAVSLTLNKILKRKAEKAYTIDKRKLGYISFLHAFGRDIKRHPHIHVLYA